MILFLKQYSSKRSINFFANACVIASKSSNRARTICFGVQLNPSKFITKAKTLWTPLDIQRSKLVVAKWHSSRKSKTYVHLVFSIRWGKTSCEKNFCEENQTQGHKCKIKCFNHAFFTNCRGKWFFTTKNVRFSKNNLVHIIVFERLFEHKK